MCFSEGQRCCAKGVQIEIRRCLGFYIYKLRQPCAEGARYCGNKGKIKGAGTPVCGLNGDVRPDRVWFSWGIDSISFFLKRGILTWPNVLNRISIILIYRNLTTSPILTSILLALTSVNFGNEAKFNCNTTKPVGQFVNVLDGVSKI